MIKVPAYLHIRDFMNSISQSGSDSSLKLINSKIIVKYDKILHVNKRIETRNNKRYTH